MPYVHIQITREGATVQQKEALIKGATDLLARVLNKIQPQLSSSSRRSTRTIGASQECR